MSCVAWLVDASRVPDRVAQKPILGSILAPATRSSLAYPVARCGGLRGAGGISTDARIAANIDGGFCPKNRSAAVVPSERVRKKLCIAVSHARFLGRSQPRS
jgi:hypothetical protein